MAIYVISDTHFGMYKEGKKKQFTEKEKTDYIVKRWNKAVKPNDEVYIIGDFSDLPHKETKKLIKVLNGKKYLIIGNHDEMYLDEYMKPDFGFQWVRHYNKLEYKGITFVMTHYPMFKWEGKGKGNVHLHGHINEQVSEFGYIYNVFARGNYYTPIRIDNVLKKIDYKSFTYNVFPEMHKPNKEMNFKFNKVVVTDCASTLAAVRSCKNIKQLDRFFKLYKKNFEKRKHAVQNVTMLMDAISAIDGVELKIKFE